MTGRKVTHLVWEDAMYFDRFDIVEAWYYALSHCHTGQGSRAYERLSKIARYYSPGRFESLSGNAQEIYEQACRTLNGKGDKA